MDDDDVETLARSLYDALAKQPAGTILAVWQDASFTCEGFGFRWRQADGRIIEPLLTFPSKSAITYRELCKRLGDSFLRRSRLAGPSE